MPMWSGAMQRPSGCRCGMTLRHRYDEVGLPCRKIHKQQDMLSGKFLGQDVEKDPHACGGPARPRAVHPTKTCVIAM
jgi:hypothetical protein